MNCSRHAELYLCPLRRKFIQTVLTSPIDIPDNTETQIVWDDFESRYGDWDDSGFPTGEVLVPRNAGVRRIRVLAQSKWANNSQSFREMKIKRTRNGVVDTLAHMNNRAVALSNNQIEAIIDVEEEDTISLWVKQKSGSGQNFGDDEVWMRVEEYYES